MSGFRLSPEAESQLDTIWVYIARESGSINTAKRVIDQITERFWLLAQHPFIGGRRHDLRDGLRCFTAGNYVIIYAVEEDETVAILYVFHGSQDIEHFFQL